MRPRLSASAGLVAIALLFGVVQARADSEKAKADDGSAGNDGEDQGAHSGSHMDPAAPRTRPAIHAAQQITATCRGEHPVALAITNAASIAVPAITAAMAT